MEHKTKATPDEMSDILYTLRQELRDNPSDMDLWGIYVDALTDAGHDDLADYYRAAIERQNYFTPYPSIEEFNSRIEELAYSLGMSWVLDDDDFKVRMITNFFRDNGINPDVRRIEQFVETLGDDIYNDASARIDEEHGGEGDPLDYIIEHPEYAHRFIQNSIVNEEGDWSGFTEWFGLNTEDMLENHIGWVTYQSDREDEGLPTYDELIETERGFKPKQDLPPDPPEPDQPEEKSLRGKYKGKSWPFPESKELRKRVKMDPKNPNERNELRLFNRLARQVANHLASQDWESAEATLVGFLRKHNLEIDAAEVDTLLERLVNFGAWPTEDDSPPTTKQIAKGIYDIFGDMFPEHFPEFFGEAALYEAEMQEQEEELQQQEPPPPLTEEKAMPMHPEDVREYLLSIAPQLAAAYYDITKHGGEDDSWHFRQYVHSRLRDPKVGLLPRNEDAWNNASELIWAISEFLEGDLYNLKTNSRDEVIRLATDSIRNSLKETRMTRGPEDQGDMADQLSDPEAIRKADKNIRLKYRTKNAMRDSEVYQTLVSDLIRHMQGLVGQDPDQIREIIRNRVYELSSIFGMEDPREELTGYSVIDDVTDNLMWIMNDVEQGYLNMEDIPRRVPRMIGEPLVQYGGSEQGVRLNRAYERLPKPKPPYTTDFVPEEKSLRLKYRGKSWPFPEVRQS